MQQVWKQNPSGWVYPVRKINKDSFAVRVHIESKREIAKKVAAYEDWAVKCLLKARKLRTSGSFDDALHLEIEADYWFGMAEKTWKAEKEPEDTVT